MSFREDARASGKMAEMKKVTRESEFFDDTTRASVIANGDIGWDGPASVLHKLRRMKRLRA